MAASTHPKGSDPRIMARLPGEAGAEPVVRLPRQGIPPWGILLGAVLLAILLFTALEARRRAASAPAVKPGATDRLAPQKSLPPLYLPPWTPMPMLMPDSAEAAPAPSPKPPPPQIIYQPAPPPPISPNPVRQAPQRAPRAPSEPALVFDAGSRPSAADQAATGESANVQFPSTPGATRILGSRSRAGVFANPLFTVSQGTLIPAVLETALNSTRPGLARAIVSHDVRGFDGRLVLIPRGSRLIGEYHSETAPGQNRLLVNWVRLIRPDGVTVNIESPASDKLGGTGIKAQVNSHFFERFAGAILRSALDFGVNLAGRAVDGPIVVLPGIVQQGTGTTQAIDPSQIMPTLKVKQGTSISIFVARDLDFSGRDVER